MRVAILTREFPPDVYGGAGVHVDFLVRELRRLIEVDVQCMGEPREGATAHSEDDPRLAGGNAALRILSADLSMTAAVSQADLVHSHTWYANMAGHWSKLLYDVPHVATAHSLEPQRPWKAEQLGGGYRLSSWAERTAYESADAVVAVSHGMRADVLTAYPSLDAGRVHVIHNGIDSDFYRPDPETDVLERLGVDLARPYVAFVGRITRQKGVPHLLRAGLLLDPDVQLVLLAGAADTPELKAETDQLIEDLRTARDGAEAVEVTVQDSGAGIGKADLDHIFDAFYTTKADGLGMGLAIVRSMVEAHGGRVGARNNPEGGATFSFTLPAIQEAP